MGKRLPKSELLKEIGMEREALDALLKLVAPERMIMKGVTPGGWSVKDILAHLLGWQAHMLGWHKTELGGGSPSVPAPGMSWKDLKRFNDMIYQEHRDRPLQDVLSKWKRAHDEVVRLVEATSDSDLTTVRRFKWTGPTWTLSDFCRAQTASHYRWARKWIRPWLRAHSNPVKVRF
jgi:hypothetical protein